MKVYFEFLFLEENMVIVLVEGFVKKFKFIIIISISNMYLFDVKGIIKKYDMLE